jgi:hypothetical protein
MCNSHDRTNLKRSIPSSESCASSFGDDTIGGMDSVVAKWCPCMREVLG